MHIAVDLMGSDSSPLLLYEGALEAAHLFGSECQITVIGTQKILNECQKKNENDPPLEFLVVEDEVFMEDSPLLVVRRKPNSSMAVGIKSLKKKKFDAFVSAGNTGAITAFSAIELNKLPGIDRPALLTFLPTEKGKMAILDVGANVAFRPHYFLHFAIMGCAYQKMVHDIESPNFGLLNIGAEASKGTKKIRKAFDYFVEYEKELLNLGFNFKGNIESRDAFHGKVDVLVTEGFTGNVFLKTCEGVSSFILDQVQKRFLSNNEMKKGSGFKSLEKYLDYAEYPGAVLMGVDEVVVKCHGYSTSLAMLNGIKGAYSLVKKRVVPKIAKYLKSNIFPIEINHAY